MLTKIKRITNFSNILNNKFTIFFVKNILFIYIYNFFYIIKTNV